VRRKGPVPLDALLASKEMVLVLGSGGVGKTTISAALGLAAAVEQGGRVLVLTVDPAKRLADALGVHYQTIGCLERGEYDPSLSLALRVARFSDAPVEAVFSLEPFPTIASQDRRAAAEG